MTNIKLAESHNIPEILTLMEEFYAIDNYKFDKLKTEKNLQHFIHNKALGRFWMIEVEAKIVGYVCLTFGFSFEYDGKLAFIDELYIKQDFRNKGLGKQAIEFIATLAEELEIKTLHLEVEKHNETGMGLYIKQGFKDTGRHLMTKWLD